MGKEQFETLHEEFLNVLNALNEIRQRLEYNKPDIPALAKAESASFSTLKQNVKKALTQLEHAATHPGESVADFVYLVASLTRLEDAIYSLEKYARSKKWRKLSRICLVLRRAIERNPPEVFASLTDDFVFRFDDIRLKALLEIGEYIITSAPNQVDSYKCAIIMQKADLSWLPPIDYKEEDLHREVID